MTLWRKHSINEGDISVKISAYVVLNDLNIWECKQTIPENDINGFICAISMCRHDISTVRLSRDGTGK